eukprot:TRINITY_DN50416_c0_g1_i1.p1 TRINITY_DN50416_c0_g1~~TRINITY_DN50416_c0_g1_i1.p1  ORF type:complete len:1109 (+),score=260.84 TRINITY_DN50416_c0_g1_i1:117-3443(+)
MGKDLEITAQRWQSLCLLVQQLADWVSASTADAKPAPAPVSEPVVQELVKLRTLVEQRMGDLQSRIDSAAAAQLGRQTTVMEEEAGFAPRSKSGLLSIGAVGGGQRPGAGGLWGATPGPRRPSGVPHHGSFRASPPPELPSSPSAAGGLTSAGGGFTSGFTSPAPPDESLSPPGAAGRPHSPESERRFVQTVVAAQRHQGQPEVLVEGVGSQRNTEPGASTPPPEQPADVRARDSPPANSVRRNTERSMTRVQSCNTISPRKSGLEYSLSGGVLPLTNLPSELDLMPDSALGSRAGTGVGDNAVVRTSQRLQVYSLEDEQDEAMFAAQPALILPDCGWYTAFEFLYLLLTCYEAGVTTAAAAGNLWEERPDWWLVALHGFATAVYIVHIALQHRVAVLHGWQLIDEDQALVRRLYHRGWFPADVAMSIPYDLIVLPFSVLGFRTLQLLRTLRITRVFTLFRTSDPLRRQRYQAHLSLAVVLLTHHVIACLHYCARYGCDGGERGNWEEYTESLYWAVQTTTSVGYGDIQERTADVGMRWLALTVMLVGSGLYGWFLGQISAYVMSLDHLERKQEETKAMLTSLMVRYDVPLSIQKEAFCIYPLIFSSGAHNFAEALELLPPFMRLKISDYMTIKLLRQVPMFAEAEHSILRALARLLTRHVVEPDCELISIGETGKEMYFLVTGAVEVLAPAGDQGQEGELRRVVILRDGSWFGEIAILKESRRTAAIRTITACDLYMLTKEDFWDLLTLHPGSRFENKILEEVERRMQGVSHAAALDPGGADSGAAPLGGNPLQDATVALDALDDDGDTESESEAAGGGRAVSPPDRTEESAATPGRETQRSSRASRASGRRSTGSVAPAPVTAPSGAKKVDAFRRALAVARMRTMVSGVSAAQGAASPAPAALERSMASEAPDLRIDVFGAKAKKPANKAGMRLRLRAEAEVSRIVEEQGEGRGSVIALADTLSMSQARSRSPSTRSEFFSGSSPLTLASRGAQASAALSMRGSVRSSVIGDFVRTPKRQRPPSGANLVDRGGGGIDPTAALLGDLGRSSSLPSHPPQPPPQNPPTLDASGWQEAVPPGAPRGSESTPKPASGSAHSLRSPTQPGT